MDRSPFHDSRWPLTVTPNAVIGGGSSLWAGDCPASGRVAQVVPICIPYWYAAAVSIQIAVRLPDDMVTELDDLIAAGLAPSRASVVEAALRRELRQYLYAREAQILAADSEDADLAALHAWVASNRPTLD